MNYEESLIYLNQSSKFGIKLGLENVKLLLKMLGNPQKELQIIHVAGTNGKGSTSCMIESVLKEQGYRVGLYTSPFLEIPNEIMRFNGEVIPNEDFAESVSAVKNATDKIQMHNPDYLPTEFEIMTAAAFVYFRMKAVEFVILEVGMGGRMDATNIIENSIVSVIAPITMDHMQYLGSTIEKIAYEKCGIIKPNSIVVSAAQSNEVYGVIENAANEQNAIVVKAENSSIEALGHDMDGQEFKFSYNEYTFSFRLGLLGEYQIVNCQTALVTLITLIYSGVSIDSDSIVKGMEKARWPGRFEIVNKNPVVVIDGAHNVDGMKALASSLKRYFSGSRIILVLGILKDKEYREMIKTIVPNAAEVIITEPQNERKLNALTLAKLVGEINSNIMICTDDTEAVKQAVAKVKTDEVVCIAGSLYLIGKIRGLFHGPSRRNR